MVQEQLKAWALERGYAVAWGAAARAVEVQQEIAQRHSTGELAPNLYADALAPVVDSSPLPFDGTMVMVAVPRPASLVRFELEDGGFEGLIPPTYERYRVTFEDVRRDLAKNALPGARVEHFGGPCKGLAARLGLVRYGRNNITYAPGIGSYMQLCAYVTDADLGGASSDYEGGPRLLDECDGCTACQKACPTKAIDADRVLLHGERCVTFLNEDTGDWPEWLPERAHTCLVGCLLCQRACPANPKLEVVDTGVTFSLAETRALLGTGNGDGVEEEFGARVKLHWLGQPGLEPVLGRNLRALLKRRRRAV